MSGAIGNSKKYVVANFIKKVKITWYNVFRIVEHKCIGQYFFKIIVRWKYGCLQSLGVINARNNVLVFVFNNWLFEVNFFVGKQQINVSGVQTEVDAGYEGRDQIVLIEAKNKNTKDIIIRQLYYPFRQWQTHTKKKVITLFFEKDDKTNIYSIWQFVFNDVDDYNSIKLKKMGRFKIAS